MTVPVVSPSERSFFSLIPQSDREPILQAYREYLDRREGHMDFEAAAFSEREAQLGRFDSSPIRFKGRLDPAQFERLYGRFSTSEGASPEMLMMLIYAKFNASESYGVAVARRLRSKVLDPPPNVFHEVEKIIYFEEEYHTRILVGASRHFGIEVSSTYRVLPVLKSMLQLLVRLPPSLFHPMLLGFEVTGQYILNFTLNAVRRVFRDDPELRDVLEERLIEVMIDEAGHACFNRTAVGGPGLFAARQLAAVILTSVIPMTPEFKAAGFDRHVLGGIRSFDFRDLPEEVRHRAFFA